MTQPLDFVQPGQPFKPSAASWNAFVDTARTVRARRTITGVPDGQWDSGGNEALIGRLITAISPASNSLTGATEFKVALWVPDPDIDPQTVPKTLMEEVDDDFVLIETYCVNRSTKLSANSGGMVILNRINGELIPCWVEDICPD